ncbi:MAG: lipase family protein [Acidimicrobiales bacterium]
MHERQPSDADPRPLDRLHPRVGAARMLAAAAVALGVLLAACTSGVLSTHQASPAPTVTSPPPAGLPAFYGVPDPLPAGRPGDVVKAEQLGATGMHGTVWRVMYHSRSLQGADIVVTGLIAIPATPPPAGGYQVVSWAHGTSGIADTCAPSLQPAQSSAIANALLDKGYAITATDYEGLGTPGRHPYIVGESEARGVLDIVRAARNIAAVHAGDRYLVWGHSQGGHAAMFALHIADTWAPELHLVGVVAGAPPSQLLLINAALQTSPFKHYILMAAAGLNAAYGDAQAPLDEVLTPAGLQALDQVDHGCSSDFAKALLGTDFKTLQRADPASVPTWAALLEANDPGRFTQPSKEPLLIIQGGNDEQIPVVSTQLLLGQLCKTGQVAQRWIYPGQSHAGVIAPSLADMLTWIGDRFAGKPAPDPTPPVGQANVAAQRCPA